MPRRRAGRESAWCWRPGRATDALRLYAAQTGSGERDGERGDGGGGAPHTTPHTLAGERRYRPGRPVPWLGDEHLLWAERDEDGAGHPPREQLHCARQRHRLQLHHGLGIRGLRIQEGYRSWQAGVQPLRGRTMAMRPCTTDRPHAPGAYADVQTATPVHRFSSTRATRTPVGCRLRRSRTSVRALPTGHTAWLRRLSSSHRGPAVHTTWLRRLSCSHRGPAVHTTWLRRLSSRLAALAALRSCRSPTPTPVPPPCAQGCPFWATAAQTIGRRRARWARRTRCLSACR